MVWDPKEEIFESQSSGSNSKYIFLFQGTALGPVARRYSKADLFPVHRDCLLTATVAQKWIKLAVWEKHHTLNHRCLYRDCVRWSVRSLIMKIWKNDDFKGPFLVKTLLCTSPGYCCGARSDMHRSQYCSTSFWTKNGFLVGSASKEAGIGLKSVSPFSCLGGWYGEDKQVCGSTG